MYVKRLNMYVLGTQMSFQQFKLMPKMTISWPICGLFGLALQNWEWAKGNVIHVS